jgi:hypothetical protein
MIREFCEIRDAINAEFEAQHDYRVLTRESKLETEDRG